MISDIGGRRPTPTAYSSQPPRPMEGGNPTLSIGQMTGTEVLNIFKTAAHHGSGFQKRLAQAGILADPDNKALILRTWPFFVQTYGPGTALYKEDL